MESVFRNQDRPSHPVPSPTSHRIPRKPSSRHIAYKSGQAYPAVLYTGARLPWHMRRVGNRADFSNGYAHICLPDVISSGFLSAFAVFTPYMPLRGFRQRFMPDQCSDNPAVNINAAYSKSTNNNPNNSSFFHIKEPPYILCSI